MNEYAGFWFLVGGWSTLWFIIGFDLRGRRDKRKRD